MANINLRSVRFKAVRASGPGGQRTNRRATKVQARVPLKSISLDVATQRRLAARLGKRLSRRGEIEVQSESSRSQVQNRREALKRLREVIMEALKVRRRRIATERPRRANEKRIKEKKLVSEKKHSRRGNF
ncbi:MAG: peptide chain release factor-like protein [Candidatus Jorgensenbacteria bacterium]